MKLRTLGRITTVLGVAAAVLLPVSTSSARLAPGEDPPGHGVPTNGQLVIARHIPGTGDADHIYTLNPDGSHRHLVTPRRVQCPHWSPDGRLIATCGLPPNSASGIFDPDTGKLVRRVAMPNPALFTACPVWKPGMRWLACEGFGKHHHPGRNGIYALRISDGHLARVTRNPGGDDIPGSYSPNGRRLVLWRANGEKGRLVVVRSDGSHPRVLRAAGTGVSSSGDWSTSGNRIVFSRHVTPNLHSTLWVMRADGSGLHQVVPAGRPHLCGGKDSDPHARGCTGAAWSPDDTKIAFVRETSREDDNVWVVNADGTGLHRVTHAARDISVDWGTHPLAH